MSEAINVYYGVDEESLLCSVDEFMSSIKDNKVFSVSSLGEERFKSYRKFFIQSVELGVELYIIDDPFERIIFIDDKPSLVGLYKIMNKQEHYRKHHIHISETQHKRFNRLIGLYCNLPKISNTWYYEEFSNYKVLELCMLGIFNLDARITRVSTLNTPKVDFHNNGLEENTFSLCDLNEDNFCTFCLQASVVERGTASYSFNCLRIKFYGNLDSLVLDLFKFMLENNISTDFKQDNIEVVNNKILELEME